MTITFPSAPAVGTDFQVQIDSPSDVGCENSIRSMSETLAGSGQRTTSLGVIQSEGFFPLKFIDTTTGEEQVFLVSTFESGAGVDGSVIQSPASASALSKFLAQMRKGANVQKWFDSYPKGDELTQKIVQISGTGVLVTVCIVARPLGCKEAAASGWDLAVDLSFDFLSYCIDQMVNVDQTLTAAEGQELKDMIKTGQAFRDLADAVLGNRTAAILAAADIIVINLNNPNAKLTFGLQKDAAGKANSLIQVFEKIP